MSRRVSITESEFEAIRDAVDMINTAMESAGQSFIDSYTPTVDNLNSIVKKYYGKKKVKHWSEVMKDMRRE